MPKPQSRHSNHPQQHDYTSPRATAQKTRKTRKTSKPQPQARPFGSPSQRVNTSPRVTVQEMHKTQPQSRSFESLMKQHVKNSPRATAQRKRKTPKPQSRHFNSLDRYIHSSVQERKKKKKKKEEKKGKREKTPARRPSESETQPGDYERSPIILESDEEGTPHTAFADDGVELQLGDISDFELRKKTAQLLAIAPGLPVADLYHLLVEKEGRFEAAKEHVIRQSQTPFSSTSLQVREKTIPPADPVPKDEDVTIKIDFDDDFFIYDDECPDNQLPDLRQPKQSSHPKKAKKSRAVPKPRKGLATKKTARESGEYTGDINRGIRETSHDREFIASDDEVPLDDSDADYSDSDQSVATVTSSSDSDTDMAIDEEPEYPSSVSAETASEMDTDDDEDLEIDMQPEYAYNADVWASPNPG